MTADSLSEVEPALRGWISTTGLLTHKLGSATGSYAVEVELEKPSALSAEEAKLLGCAVQPALLREIELDTEKRACIFARTLIPDSTLRDHPWLADLGDSPLGETLLRRRGDVTRSGFEIAQLDPDDELYAKAASRLVADPEALWARRSVFRIGQAGLLVYEVLLPPIAGFAVPAGIPGEDRM